MSLKFSQWIGLIGVAATIPLVQTVAVAKSPVEVGQIAKDITVLITNSSGNGSGVIIQHQGSVYTVLTAAHVVQKKDNYKITTPDNIKYKVISSSIVSAPGDIDLAVVKFLSTTNYNTAMLGNCNFIKAGMDIYVAGFAGKDKAFSTPNWLLKKGMVEANANQVQPHGYSLIYDSYTLPGMSGGGVLNTDGELVAIHGEGNTYKDGRNNATNLAIPIERFGAVASRMGVNLNGQVAAIVVNATPTADDYFVAGVQKDKNSDYQGAFVDYNRAIQLNPKYASAYAGRGDVRQRFGNYTAAIADYTLAIKIDPNVHDIYYSLRGVAKSRSGDKQGAIKDFNEAIKIDPSSGNSYINRGVAQFESGNTSAAIADQDRAIALNRNSATAYGNRGAFLIIDNKEQEALADLERAIELDANYAYAYADRGFVRETLGDRQRAISDYRQAVKLNPQIINEWKRQAALIQKYNTASYQKFQVMIQKLEAGSK
jgi:Tfp pilus assembly protein PilF